MAYDGMWNFDSESRLVIFLFEISSKPVHMQDSGCSGNWSTLCERLACLEVNDQEAANSAGSSRTRAEEHDAYLHMIYAKIETDAVQLGSKVAEAPIHSVPPR